MRVAPGVPSAMNGLPSFITMVGAMLLTIRLPGAMEFAVPGCGSNMFIVLFSSIPVPGVVTLEPNAAWMVCVVETTLPSASATVR